MTLTIERHHYRIAVIFTIGIIARKA